MILLNTTANVKTMKDIAVMITPLPAKGERYGIQQ